MDKQEIAINITVVVVFVIEIILVNTFVGDLNNLDNQPLIQNIVGIMSFFTIPLFVAAILDKMGFYNKFKLEKENE